MICLIALIVLGILSIFSAKYRADARQAFDCVFKRITLRKCDTAFDQKMKARITTKISLKFPNAGKFLFKHFEAISWILTIITILSILGVLFGVYNFVAFGNCNGPDSTAFCAFSPETYGNGIDFFGIKLFQQTHSPSEVKPIVLGNAISLGPENAEIQVIEVGCFSCPFTKQAEPIVQELLEKYDGRIRFSFKPFPLPTHAYSFEAAEASLCANDQEKFWEYKKILFEQQSVCTASNDANALTQHYISFAEIIGLNKEQFSECLASGKFKNEVQLHKQQAIDAGIYGTPTFYVNGKVLVAPKTLKEFEDIINE
ncbi:MAG: thioredoxin domain-containing protein [archaeon]|nr:thioredoxin domain-containing protein [archaeon]